LCYGRPHVQAVSGTKFINVRKNNQGKYKYFDCKIANCPNGRNGVDFNYNIPEGYKKIEAINTRTTTSTFPTDVASFGLERQASLPKTSTIVDNPVTQTSTKHQAELLQPEDIQTGNVPSDVPAEATERATKGETIELLPYCTDLPHIYDSEVEHDRHWAEEDDSSYLCQQETCPHRTNGVTWPEGKWRKEYYKPNERSKATELRNPYHVLGIETIPENNITTYTATQVNVSNFNPPNVIPTADTSANPQTVLPSQGMNMDTVLQ
jgi:hypothetical protein